MAQQGDRAQVHCVIRCQDGSRASSRRRPPIELTVGACRRLPGLGLALLGMAPGSRKTVTLSPEQAYGMRDPARVRRCSRERFAEQTTLEIGTRVGLIDARGRRRMVRVLQVDSKSVLVDTNHRWAGQTLELDVELIAVASGSEVPPKTQPGDNWHDEGGEG
jgi:peptidylprolyl isomerase